MQISEKDLCEILQIKGLTGIRMPVFSNDVVLERGNKVGLFLPGKGLILYPEYDEVTRFGDIVLVGKRTDSNILYGAYQITTSSLVMEIAYTKSKWYKLLDVLGLDKFVRHPYT